MDLPHVLLDRDFEQIQVLKDRAAGLLAVVAIHSTVLGPAFGGIRRWPYQAPGEALLDALNLAEAMTLKCAITGIAGGGGKVVILQTPDLAREKAYRLVGECVERLGGGFYTGPDVGTYPQDLELVAERTRFVARAGPQGPGDLAVPTARGVLAGIRAVAARLGAPSLAGVRIAVQGLGEVGYRLARLLAEAGALLQVSDVRSAKVEQAVSGSLGATPVEPKDIVAAEADILAPCALGGIIDEKTLPSLRVHAVAGSANNVLAAPDCGAMLFARGILYAPDFVINSGALLHGALFHLEGSAPPAERIEQIGAMVGEILERSKVEQRPPEQIAQQMARARLAQAQAARDAGL